MSFQRELSALNSLRPLLFPYPALLVQGRAAVLTLPSKKAVYLDFDSGQSHPIVLPGSIGNMSFSAAKEADLYIIRAGNERYEIPAAVIYGG